MHDKQHTNGMVIRYPATRWQDALPTGSGIVGGLVYGNIQRETVVLNHDRLYYPRVRPEMADVSDKLPAMRALMDRGECREAAQLMRETYAARVDSTASAVDPYQPLCSIRLESDTDGPFRQYRRGVDFDTGRAWVTWTDNAATFTREVFVSRITDTVFLRIRADKPGVVSGSLALIKTVSEQVNETLIHTGAKLEEFKLDAIQEASAAACRVSFVGTYPNGLSFGAVGTVAACGGRLSERNDVLVVEGADELVLQVRLFVGEKPADALARLALELGATATTFDVAFAEHAAIHRELFNRVVLDLGEDSGASNEELLMEAYEGTPSDALIKRMCDYGRYLLICSSRPGGMPANLQGIWNGDYAPAWNGDVHTDENIQMNYWPALQAGLPETVLPLVDYFEHYMDDFRQNARCNFGCRGIEVPLAMTTHGFATPMGYANWTAAAGWLGQHFYDYYLFTGDSAFLKEHVVPWLKETALFYEDFLYEGADGKLVFNPSVSPENRPANGSSLLAINATMDVAVCREVLSNLCEACEALGMEAEGVARWKAMLARLPAYQVNEDGAISEWMHPGFDDNYHHRHQSHLYPVFPGLEITPESNPGIFEACRVAVEKRLVIGLTSQTGWSMAHMANIYARLGLGDRALECLEILTRSSVGPNLFTYHNDWRMMGLSSGWGGDPPFQIDANFGMTAAVFEMLVFSKPGLVKLLPALPTRWKTGKVSGVCCRGGITVDMTWDAGAGTIAATLTSKVDQTVRLCLPVFVGDVRQHTTIAVSYVRDGYMRVSLQADCPFNIQLPEKHGGTCKPMPREHHRPSPSAPLLQTD